MEPTPIGSFPQQRAWDDFADRILLAYGIRTHLENPDREFQVAFTPPRRPLDQPEEKAGDPATRRPVNLVDRNGPTGFTPLIPPEPYPVGRHSVVY